MPRPEKGEFEDNKKSAWNFEYYDSSWESDYMKDLEADESVLKWTKNHGIIIPYWDSDGKLRGYKPDFLVQTKDSIEIREIKGGHLLRTEQFKRKISAAEEWCKARKMKFRIISRY
jgi:hypothetical protein